MKRLTLLETNSTQSLQYIEEQSRLLRDAFSNIERRQNGKITEFLEGLNTTVLSQLRVFRKNFAILLSGDYDRMIKKQQSEQLWKSTVIELENQKEQTERDIGDINSKLIIVDQRGTILFIPRTQESKFTDYFYIARLQKRISVIQSLLLLMIVVFAMVRFKSSINSP